MRCLIRVQHVAFRFLGVAIRIGKLTALFYLPSGFMVKKHPNTIFTTKSSKNDIKFSVKIIRAYFRKVRYGIACGYHI